MRKIAEENNLPEYKIKDVINSHFAFAAHILRTEVDDENNKFPTIRIPFFGKFFVPDYVRERLLKFRSENI